MNPILRNLLAVIVGCVIGSMANIFILKMFGAEMDLEKLQEMSQSWTFKDALVPFAAHAGGTLVGALIAVLLGASHKMWLALIVAIFNLLGGITAAFMIPAPSWFIAMDLICAYLPMGWLVGKFVGERSKS